MSEYSAPSVPNRFISYHKLETPKGSMIYSPDGKIAVKVSSTGELTDIDWNEIEKSSKASPAGYSYLGIEICRILMAIKKDQENNKVDKNFYARYTPHPSTDKATALDEAMQMADIAKSPVMLTINKQQILVFPRDGAKTST